jgi:hypothetical protein
MKPCLKPSTSGQAKAPNGAHKAADVARESDGRQQLVGYPGWQLILQRIARRRP